MTTAAVTLSGISLCAFLVAAGWTPRSAAADGWQQDFARHEFRSGERTLRYRLLAAPPDGDKPPLVLFLHGSGERGDDNAAQLMHGAHDFHRRQAVHPCIMLVPQCPPDMKWVEVDWDGQSGAGTFPAEPSEPLRLALELVDSLIAAGRVDPERIYVTGLSMGGYGTWFAAGLPGTRFAAAAPVCGGGDPRWAPRYVGLPLRAFHGADDRVVPVGRSREMIEAIRACGGQPTYTEYPGVAHDSWTRTFADDDFHDWLFAQRRRSP